VESAPRSLNLGIVAHVDAGKTSLTERLLHAAGVIDQPGSVDDGSTQTDTLALERERGITIRAAVVSFELEGPEGPVTVNLIDTPGHSDFVAEVERSLAALDGAVLVVSAVEGVQAQTRVLKRVLAQLGIPTLIYVNKIDRVGARQDGLLREIAERLTTNALPLGTVTQLGSTAASYVPYAADDVAHVARLTERLSESDDRLLADAVDAPDTVTPERLAGTLARQARLGLVHPVVFGSAVTGAGLEELAAAMTTYLPARRGRVDLPLSGTVFAIDRGSSGQKVAVVRVRSGVLRVRDKVRFGAVEDRVTAISIHDRGGVVRSTVATAGRMARVVGLDSARVGDVIGVDTGRGPRPQFSPPTLETVIEPLRAHERTAMFTALSQLAEQDPLINLRHDDERGETHVSLFGEVQKEVIAATLARDHGIEVRFRETSVVCIERVVGTGAAHEIIDVAPNPFLATVGLRVEPAAPGAGVQFRLEVELGSMPPAFFRAVEDTVHAVLGEGLHGWPIPDCSVTMTHSGFWPRQSAMHAAFDKSMSSTAGDFRNLTPLVLRAALRQAGTRVEEPVHRFDLDLPAADLGAALTLLARNRAVPHETVMRGEAAHLSGVVPAARVHALQQRIPALTGGEGDLACSFAGYQPVTGDVPERSRPQAVSSLAARSASRTRRSMPPGASRDS
jgi:ribosomal protection tetracycline resistance protein